MTARSTRRGGSSCRADAPHEVDSGIRLRIPLWLQFLVAFVLPPLVLFALFAYVALEVTERNLDDELGARMRVAAASASTQLSGKYLAKVEQGNDADLRYQQERGKLERLAAATGVRYVVLDRDFRAKLDSDGAMAIDDPYYAAQLDGVEIGRVFADGAPVASVITFEGDDGRRYKAGYAALRGGDGEVALVLRAEAPVEYFDPLDALRGRLVSWGLRLAAVLLVGSILAAYLINRPLRRLVNAAERIGRGELDAPVKATRRRDEIGLLGETMDRMRAQLRARDAHMQQMLAGIAHEVRNPLAGMTLFTGILRDELEGDERRAHVDKIARELGHLERVVQDFLEYARRPPPELAAVAIRPLLDEVAQLVAADAERAGVEVAVEGEATARADAAQLRRALLNLARNAIQAATPGDGPAVRLAVARAGDAVHVDVVDRGPEIPPDVRERIFEPFFTTREKGTGLGLAFVREIARDHGGDVAVACGDGETRFRVTLQAS